MSCHRINYRPKTIGDDCCTIVRQSSDATVRWDYRPNHRLFVTVEVKRNKSSIELWTTVHWQVDAHVDIKTESIAEGLYSLGMPMES